MLDIQPLLLSSLPKLHSLFNTACGRVIDLQDEIDYFQETKPKDGLIAYLNGEAIGYIRSFPCGPHLWVGDIYLSPDTSLDWEKALLLAYESQENCVPLLRIDLLESEKSRQKLLTQLGYTVDQKYLYFRWETPIQEDVESISLANEKDDFSQILACLNAWDNLTVEGLKRSAQMGQLAIRKANGITVSAALLDQNKKEIIQMATHPNHRMQKHAQNLLRGLPVLYQKSCFELKVKETNKCAQHVYKQVGFQAEHKKNEVWMTKRLK